MAGIDKITAEIQNEARQKADAILGEARAKAEAALSAAQKKADEQVESAKSAAQKEADAMGERAKSQADLLHRQQLLGAKQEVIESVIQKAYDKLDSLPDEKYFAMIKKLLSENVKADSGEICFSKRDLSRLPADFAKTASEIAQKCGGSLSVSTEEAPIDNGFLLKYGGIEENCSLTAIFTAQKDRMLDQVHAALWK